MDTRLRGGIADDADGFARAFAGAGVRLGTLSADWQAAKVPNAAIAFDTLQAFEVHADFAAKITFYDVLAVLNCVNDLGELRFAQILCANSRIDIGPGQYVFRVTGADAVNITERDVDAFIRRNFYTNDTSHVLVKSLN